MAKWTCGPKSSLASRQVIQSRVEALNAALEQESCKAGWAYLESGSTRFQFFNEPIQTQP